ncbi:MAG: hypothetical protein Q9221_002719 [Calogaya cf. arnoldii]
MGLSGPRKRAKISHDPNNTAWTRSESRFGQRLLLSQGWKPGSSLGASNASYTNNPGSISHVRVTVKDDNCGLGAKNGSFDEDRPTTGLDGLQDLLGRLNGKNNQLLQAEQRSRVDSRTAVYAGKRWGFHDFVSGGLLVGDRLQQREETAANGSCLKTNVIDSKTRQTLDPKTAEAGNKKVKRAHEAAGSESLGLTAWELQRSNKSRTEDVLQPESAEQEIITDSSTLEKEKRMQRSERKAQRRSRRAEKTAARALRESEEGAPRMVSSVVARDEAEVADVARVPSMTRAYGRHTGRQRSIRHKKMSLMDQKALNEVGLSEPIVGFNMSNENSPPQTPTSPSPRRASFSPGQLFGRGPTNTNGGTAPYPTPIATAAANAQAQSRRRLSITSLGLSGSPTQANAFARARQGSLSSGASNSTSVDENAIEEGDAAPMSTSPHSPFARRMSSGARALRDVRAGSANANGRSSTISISAPSVKGRGEGYNWSEQLRSRAQRSSSITNPPTSAPAVSTRERHAATSAPPPAEIPAKPPAKADRVPDHFQERILKGDFYMD